MNRVADNWSRVEVEAIVADYLSMLILELKGEPYNKAEHNRKLQAFLNNRSRGSIEMKHMNISAVMTEMGYPSIDGYKPARNYQRSLLPEVVSAQVQSNKVLHILIEEFTAEAEIEIPSVESILRALVETPKHEDRSPPKIKETQAVYHPGKVDYLSRDAANENLGLAGERFALQFEKARLIAAGKEILAERVEHSSQVEGDGLGFDIRSFEENGKDRLVEVKTTKFSRYTPFYVTPNELKVSAERDKDYYLYRVFQFVKTPRLYIAQGCLDRQFTLTPSQYLAY
ncbi:DUF3883 domain-containing protein [Desulfuromonas sp. KJ2020]|uniref:DUF3883 domain-containing protein n=1 Tax=Desulfuromonas sp. KJ2020 TaxID=2919173 RepID=UPI0020A7C25C|nr:DUF3883 domain-containing protein [Desulfuromonas sp. KJ2020]MCP3176883.1 DUF3883 domain-containing protein [Desulfuromonas sp. KJ2020]